MIMPSRSSFQDRRGDGAIGHFLTLEGCNLLPETRRQAPNSNGTPNAQAKLPARGRLRRPMQILYTVNENGILVSLTTSSGRYGPKLTPLSIWNEMVAACTPKTFVVILRTQGEYQTKPALPGWQRRRVEKGIHKTTAEKNTLALTFVDASLLGAGPMTRMLPTQS